MTIHDMLQTAADDRGRGDLDADTALRRGRARVRNQRLGLAASAVGVTAVAAALTVGGLSPQTTVGAPPATPTASGAATTAAATATTSAPPVTPSTSRPSTTSSYRPYSPPSAEPVRSWGAEPTTPAPGKPQLDKQEVLLRCGYGAHTVDILTPGPYTAGQRVATRTTIPNNEQLSCTIPDLPVRTVTTAPAAATDTAGIVAQCSLIAGWDFSGSRVLGAAATSVGTQAALETPAGELVECSITSLEAVRSTAGRQEAIVRARWRQSPVSVARPYLGTPGATAYGLKSLGPLQGVDLHGTIPLYRPDGSLATEATRMTFSYGGTTLTAPVVEGVAVVRQHLATDPGTGIPPITVTTWAGDRQLASYTMGGR